MLPQGQNTKLNIIIIKMYMSYYIVAVSLGNMVYVIGGSNGSRYLETVEYYDPSQLIWLEGTSLPYPRFAGAAVTLSRNELMDTY